MPEPGGMQSSITINAEQAEKILAQVAKLSDATNMRLEEMAKAALEAAAAVTALGEKMDNKKSAHEKLNARLTDSEKAARGFFQQQRVGDRIMRENLGIMSQITLGFSFLTQSQDGSTNAAKKVNDSFMVLFNTAQAMQFGFFQLGESGKQMGGKLGSAMMAIAGKGGWIALAIGGLSALISLIRSMNEESEKLKAAGMETFLKGLAGAPEARAKYLVSLTEQIKALDALQDEAYAGANEEGGWKSKSMEKYRLSEEGKAAREEEIEAIKKSIEQQKVQLEYQNKLIAAIKESGTEYQIMKAELGGVTLAIEQGQGDMQSNVDKRAKLQRQIAEMEMTTYDRQKQQATNMVTMVTLGKATTAELQKHLELMLKGDLSVEQRLAIQKQLFDLVQAEAALEKQREDLRRKALQGELEAQGSLQARVDQLQLEVAAPWRRPEIGQQLAEDERHRKAMEDIQIEAIHSQDIWLGAVAGELELRRHRQETNKIQTETSWAYWDMQMASIDRFGAALGAAFGNAGNEFLAIMIRALQVAIQVSKALQLGKQGRPGGSPLDVISAVLPLFGVFGFAEGGHTGSGPRSRVAGLVHKNEIVFESPLVERWGADLMQLRSTMQRGFASGGYTGGPLRGLAGPIVVTGKLKIDNGEIFLTQNLPAAQRFLAEKRT